MRAPAVELDALEPPVLQRLVRESINEYIDEEKWNESINRNQRQKEGIREETAEDEDNF